MTGRNIMKLAKIQVAIPILGVAILSGLAVSYGKLKLRDDVSSSLTGHSIVVVQGRSPEKPVINSKVEAKRQEPTKIDLSADGTTILKAFKDEHVNSAWAGEAVLKLGRSLTWPNGVRLTGIECRASTCAISGVIDESVGLNIEDVISSIEGQHAREKLAAAGFVGQKSAIYTVKTMTPLTVLFTKFVQEVKP